MAKLTGAEIFRQVELGNIVIDPFNPEQCNPNSYNCRLGNVIKWLDEIVLDLHQPPRVQRIVIPESGFMLEKGCVCLGSTVEKIGSDKFVPIIDGRSTIGRYGVAVHITAGFGDVGFLGHYTLELEARHRPTRIRAGDMICQVSFETVEGDISHYDGSYQGQIEPREPKPLSNI